MRILAISDVVRWDGYDKIVARYAPSVVVLCGDLTSDGLAAFWETAYDLIPEFVRQKDRLRKRFGVLKGENGIQIISKGLEKFDEFRRRVDKLEQKYRNTPAFTKARRKLHVEPFYRFLKFAGKRSTVLVVKGDHDSDFPRDYSVKRIDGIRGCREISSKVHEVVGFNFLGLGFAETHYRMKLRELDSQRSQRERVDVVISHAEQRRVPLLARFAPRVIVRGHFGSGCWLVSGIPAIFTADIMYAVIYLPKRGQPTIKQYSARFARSGQISKVRQIKSGSCRPWGSPKSELQLYPWLRKYSQPSR
jgi:predicted phosphodiesterase